ncbi:MAG: hypothetical protein R2769_08350 [Saprospiraceae bacterium]
MDWQGEVSITWIWSPYRLGMAEGLAGKLKHAKLTTLLLPGIGTIEDLQKARDLGVESVRIATHCTEADIFLLSTSRLPVISMDVAFALMMAHMNEPKN